MKEEPRLTTWVRLATTIILDLQLNQSPPADEAREAQANSSAEKRRAVLGRYLISSVSVDCLFRPLNRLLIPH